MARTALTYGLVGRNIPYSRSPEWFAARFRSLGLPHTYRLFDLPAVEDARALPGRFPALAGFNVTIPYKQAIISLLDELDASAEAVGAVNTVVIHSDGRWSGHNTDVTGFAQACRSAFGSSTQAALILGGGGAARAARYALLNVLGLQAVVCAARRPDLAPKPAVDWAALTADLVRDFDLIVNATPVGTYPARHDAPALPYEGIGPQTAVFDMVYNPPETELMRLAAARGARVCNGLSMLHAQAEAAWALWAAVQ